MSDRTKIILAMVFGALGLAVGIFATVVAVNARDEATSGEAVTEQVRAEFTASQAAQDAKEQASLSKAEKFVNSLSKEEGRLARKLRRTDRRLRSLETGVTAIEADQADEFDRVNRRISRTNQQVANLKRQVSNLRQEVEILGAGG
jgi:predicted RNase H-like nuclease (RuvC/YqgF family)